MSVSNVSNKSKTTLETFGVCSDKRALRFETRVLGRFADDSTIGTVAPGGTTFGQAVAARVNGRRERIAT